MALLDDLKKKATKELDKQMKNSKNKENLEKMAKKELKKKRFKILILLFFFNY